MQELISLVEDHKWWRNGLRTNLSDNPDHFRVDRNGRKWLKYKYAPFSNTVKAGPILEHVQRTFPWANAVCLNRKSAASPPMAKHRDKGNKSASMIAFLGRLRRRRGAVPGRRDRLFREGGLARALSGR